VAANFELAVGRYGDRVTVFNAGTTAIVLMGFDADICAHANIFGSKQCYAETALRHYFVPKILSPASPSPGMM
jgi:hypothetical protein